MDLMHTVQLKRTVGLDDLRGEAPRLRLRLPDSKRSTSIASITCRDHRPNPLTLAFDRQAEAYSRFAIVQHRLATWLAEWLEPPERAAAFSAIEIGAGNGLFTRLLAPRFRRLTAVDSSPRMVAEGSRDLRHVAWRVADGWQLNSGPVDRIYSASLLHWCDDPIAVLRRWRRLTKRGGRMLHGFYVAPTLVEWNSVCPLGSPVAWRGPTQWEADFRRAGWTVARSQAQIVRQRFATALELVRFLRHTGGVAPRHSSVSGLRRIMADYERTYPSSDGAPGVRSTWTFFRIEAVNESLDRNYTLPFRRRR